MQVAFGVFLASEGVVSSGCAPEKRAQNSFVVIEPDGTFCRNQCSAAEANFVRLAIATLTMS